MTQYVHWYCINSRRGVLCDPPISVADNEDVREALIDRGIGEVYHYIACNSEELCPDNLKLKLKICGLSAQQISDLLGDV